MSNEFGITGPIPQPGMTYKCTRIGYATLTRIIYDNLANVSSYNQGESAPAPFSHCVLTEIQGITTLGNGDCNSVAVQLLYEGFDSSFTDNEIRIEGQLEVTMSQEDIQTHPDFLNFAGYRGEDSRPANLGRNGAYYEEAQAGQWKFAYFLAQVPGDESDPPKLNRFAGVSSWLYPQETYVQTRMDTDWPSENELEQLGKILESSWLEGNVPLLPAALNWLYSGVSVQNIANLYYMVRRTATASGPRGWIPQMYQLNYGGNWEDQS
jgi:hypothetical protein